jgi:hypothetical protein
VKPRVTDDGIALVPVMGTLLDRGADPKLASTANATPLYAVINVVWAPKAAYPQPVAQYQSTVSYLELMEALIKAGADVNVRLTKHLWYMSYNFDQLSVSTAGATPFWRAAYGTDLDAMKLLLKYGADPSVATIKPAGRLPGSEELDADVAADDDREVHRIPARRERDSILDLRIHLCQGTLESARDQRGSELGGVDRGWFVDRRGRFSLCLLGHESLLGSADR